MIPMKHFITLSIVLILLLMASCVMEWSKLKKNKEVNVPADWPIPHYLPSYNAAQFELGKKLFYDEILSADNSISCASCHQPFAAFAHPDHDFSHGIHDQFSKRNAPALINLAWMKELHWDGAINHLENQPLAPITDPKEMGETLEHVMEKLRKDSSYPSLFKSAFGDTSIQSERFLKAIAQFTVRLISFQSKYDRVRAGTDSFLPYEAKGYVLFKKHCNSCHQEPLFTTHAFTNNGVGNNRIGDIGRASITLNPNDSFQFKIPTLRNVQVTAPYFHDGRYSALSNVIDHYVNKIDHSNPLLDARLKDPIPLKSIEKKELLYFLYTLTDSTFLSDPRFLPNTFQQQRHNHSILGN
jgi:cytochrome c peroxidase